MYNSGVNVLLKIDLVIRGSTKMQVIGALMLSLSQSFYQKSYKKCLFSDTFHQKCLILYYFLVENE